MDVLQTNAVVSGRTRPHITGTGREAEALHDTGLNPFPVIPASKVSYGPHGFLATTRLHKSTLGTLVEGSNLAEYTGRHAQNLFVLDCDSWESFHRVAAELDKRGIIAWVRNGVDGGQYWLLCADGEVANMKVGAVDVLGNKKYTMAPPSVHPSGMVYEWIKRDGPLPPVVPLELLDFLPLRLESAKIRRGRDKAHALPSVADRVLVEQDTAHYVSNSEAEYAACLSMIGAGYSDADIIHFFIMFQPPHFVKKGETEFQRSVLDKARADHGKSQAKHKSAASGKKGLVETYSSTFIAWAESRAWPGRTGGTDKAVYLALCQRLRMDGRMPFRASAREVAQLAGVNKETACKALGRLQQDGLAQADGQDKQAGASLYRLLSFPSADAEGTINRTVGETYTFVRDNVRVTLASHDVWHRDALGKSAFDCWKMLHNNSGLTVTEVAERTGRAKSTVKRAITLLSHHGLAQTDDGQRWLVDEVSVAALDRIAFECGTAGRGNHRAEKHCEERERYASAKIANQIQAWCQKEPRQKSTPRKL